MAIPAYQELEEVFHKICVLGQVEAVLHWDLATVMPNGGLNSRSEQLAELRAIQHNLITAPKIEELLDLAEKHSFSNDWQRANLREMRQRWLQAIALETNLVTAFSKAGTACEAAWREAHSLSDFELVQPKLQHLLSLVKEVANAKAECLNLDPYDALLNDFEPGSSAEKVNSIFKKLKLFLPHLLGEVIEYQKSKPITRPSQSFSEASQRKLCNKVMELLGFDFNFGRLDVSKHPFCGGVPEDVRITTRFVENEFTSSLMGVLHETGHALYERGLPTDWRLQPVGEALGMVIHESQSLLIEMQISRSKEFISYLTPMIQNAFDGDGPFWHPENIYRLYTEVKPSFIRVDADEISYPLHIILRFELEQALLKGDLNVKELPSAWNEKFEKLLGIKVPNNKLGCLQDIHWYDGAWGYFPTYTLGAIAAAQLFYSAKAQQPDLPSQIGLGNLTPLLNWLGEHVHSKGRLLNSDDLIKEATGEYLNPVYFEKHLRSRYLD